MEPVEGVAGVGLVKLMKLELFLVWFLNLVWFLEEGSVSARTFSLVRGSFFVHGGHVAASGGRLSGFDRTHREGLAGWRLVWRRRILAIRGGPLDRPAHVGPHELQAILCAQFANSFFE